MLPTRDSAKTGRAERRTRLSTVIVRDFNTPSFPNGQNKQADDEQGTDMHTLK